MFQGCNIERCNAHIYGRMKIAVLRSHNIIIDIAYNKIYNKYGRSGVMNTILGGRIRVLRESKGFTQEQVAEKMNCTRQKYARIEKGLIDISYASITTIAGILGITTEEITSAVNNIKQEIPMYRKVSDDTSDDKFEYINEMINIFYAHRTLYNSVRQVEINE